MTMHLLTLEDEKTLQNEFWNDPTTEDMSWQEFLKWKGWKWNDSAKNYYKESA